MKAQSRVLTECRLGPGTVGLSREEKTPHKPVLGDWWSWVSCSPLRALGWSPRVAQAAP